MHPGYSSDLTPDQFELLLPLLPPPATRGRPRSTSLLSVLNAILYVVVQGCKWRDLPRNFGVPWSTVYSYFRRWSYDGTWLRMQDRLRSSVRVMADRDPSPAELILDSQSVESDTFVHAQVGYDGGKKIKGRKRFSVVDTLGLVMRVWVSGANCAESTGGQEVLTRVGQMEPSHVERVGLIWVDGGYRGNPFAQWVMDVWRWIVVVVLRPEQMQGFQLLQKRWVVERTFGWWHGARRLSRDDEHQPLSSAAMIYLANIRLMVRRLA